MRVQPALEPLDVRIAGLGDEPRDQIASDGEEEAMEDGDLPDYEPDEPNVFDPGFLEVREREEGEQQAGTRAQQLYLLEAVADSRDERMHEKLKNGVRPGEFYECFVSLAWVKKAQTSAECKEFLVSLKSWCDHMRDVDVGVTALPEVVRKNK
jgi:hypothetical protein